MLDELIHQFRRSDRSERTALIGLLLLGFIGPFGPAATYLPLLIILGASIARGRTCLRALATDRVFLAFVLLGAYALVRAGFAAREFPSIAGTQWDEALDMVFPVILLVPVAWWLRSDPRRVIALLTLALAGYCLHLMIELDWHNLPRYLSGRRDDITDSKLATALYTGTGILGLVAFAPRIVRALSRWRPAGRLAGALALVGVAAILLAAQYITFSRAVILSLTVLLPPLLAFQCWYQWRPALGKHTWRLAAVVLIALVVLASLGYDRLAQRVSRGGDAVMMLVDGDLSTVPYTSTGTRLHMLHFGAKRIAQRPVVGWGPGTRATRFLAPRYGKSKLERLGDLHNEWLEITVRLGLVGLALYAVLLGLIVRAAVRGCRSGAMPRDLLLFLASTALLVGAWSMINSRFLNEDFQYFMILVLSVMYTFDQRTVELDSSSPNPGSAHRGSSHLAGEELSLACASPNNV